jgi:hypothetical protein
MATLEDVLLKRIITSEHIRDVTAEYVFELAKNISQSEQDSSWVAEHTFQLLTDKNVKELVPTFLSDSFIPHNPVPTATYVTITGDVTRPFDASSGHRFVLIHCGDEVCLVQANNTVPDKCTLTEFLTSSNWSEFRKPMSAVDFDLWIDRFCDALDETGDERTLAFKNLIGVSFEGKVDASCFVQAPIVLPWS